MKLKLTMKNKTYYRLRILEPTTSILNALKEYWVKNNVDTNIYGEWNKVGVEIEGNTSFRDKSELIYYFDDYQTIPYEFTSEELNDINNYLDKNFDKFPDNYVLGLGDVEYEELVDTIDERHKIDLAIALDIALSIANECYFSVEKSIVIEKDLLWNELPEMDIGSNCFHIIDEEGANWGNIEQECHFNMAEIIDRLDYYYEDALYKPFEERRDADITSGKKPPNLSNDKEIEKGDWDSALLYLISNDKFTDLLAEISAENFNELQELYNKVKDNLPMGYTEPVHYMADKLIAESIIETQSAYVMAEKDNKVYLSYYGYGNNDYIKPECDGWVEVPVSVRDAFFCDINDPMQIYDETGNNELFTVYDNYGEIIECQKGQVRDDIEDIGLDEHYLNEYAFCYLGMADEYDKFQEKTVLSFSDPSNDEISTLYKILNKLKINDIELYYDANNVLVAKDNDNKWVGVEFYNFLINEAFVYTENGVLGIDNELLSKFNDLTMKIQREYSFIDDIAKMYDFTRLSKYEFLKSYSYLDEGEYDATQYVYNNMSKEEKEVIDNLSLEDVDKDEYEKE